MLVRFYPLTLLLFVLGALAGCGGGGKSTSTAFACTGEGARALCLNGCSLGCTTTGCSLSDIAQNEILFLYFSEALDPTTVSTSTVQLRTATGELPVGDFFVVDNRIEFVPTLLISGAQSFFGFRASDTYTLTIPGFGDAPEVLKSSSGQPFKETFTCSLVVSQGIRDHNGVAPSATLVSPTPIQLGSVPLDTVMVLEFNEMVDATPFLGSSGGSGPVTFAARRTRPAAGGGRECDSGSVPVALPGSPRLDFDPATRRSVLTFRSTSPLPPNACVEINVTSVVTDISGRPAQPQTFTFLTQTVPLVEREIAEEFDDDAKLDRDVSAGTWAGGVAEFLQIGGDGRHGSFSTDLCQSLGVVNGKRTFVLNANNTIIPAANTRFGVATAVTDGRFFFDRMVVPTDVRLRIVGTVPPILTVAGRCDILGEIDVSGESLVALPTSAQATGQLGGVGGAFGGNGGAGGNRSTGTVPLPSGLDGQQGQAASVLGGHAYAGSVATTGGRGSIRHPASGLNTGLLFGASTGIVYGPMTCAGGGGGGHTAAGVQGRVVSNNHNEPSSTPPAPPRLDFMGPSAAGGTAVQLFPVPVGARSSEHFLVGGSGGGGSATNYALSFAFLPSTFQPWAPGAGGGGGGGALAVRVGRALLLGPAGRIAATGGNTPGATGVSSTAQAMPGGGGSGGAIVLQAGRGFTGSDNGIELQGALDVRGGTGGVVNRGAQGSSLPPNGASVVVAGGNGSPGFVRCEFPGTPTTAVFGSIQPPATSDNVGPLAETDNLVVFQSTWYSTMRPFGPEYARYEIRAYIDGSPVATVFSDDPAVSTLKAETGQALRAFFQNANLDLVTGLPAPLLGETQPTIRPWRTQVLSSGPLTGIASDGLNGYRFALVVDRGVASSVVVESVKVFYRI